MFNETIEINAIVSNETKSIYGIVENKTLCISGNVTSLGEYDGSFVFTPSDEIQVVQTNGKLLLNNITIQPIPSNYGKIAWNGSTMTIT